MNPDALEIPGDAIDNDCDSWNPPLLVYASSMGSGELWAVDYLTGATVWTLSGLGPMYDVVADPTGTLYVATDGTGISRVERDGSLATPVVSGYSLIIGLWWDAHTETVLFTDFDGVIGEYDPSTDSVTELATGLTGSPFHAIRLAGDDRLWVTYYDDRTLEVYDPAAATWDVVASFSFRPWHIVPANDGGFWVGSGDDDLVAHVSRFGDVTEDAVGRAVADLTPGPLGDGELVFADMDSAVHSYDMGFHGSITTRLTDPFGVCANPLLDTDGDGYVAIALGGDDCDDLDPSINVVAVDTFGTGVDENCDFVDGNDADGDGVPVDHDNPACADQDDTDPSVGALPACARPSCAETLAARGVGTPSGTYTLDPNGDGDLSDAYDAYCDMDYDDGGWTLVARFSNADTANWMADDGGWWYTRTTEAGDPLDPTPNADMLGAGFWLVDADEMRLTRSDNPTDDHLMMTTGSCLGGQDFRSMLTSYGTYTYATAWSSNAVRGGCDASWGNNYAATSGFGEVGCSSDIGGPYRVSFYADWGSGDGAVLMLGGGGSGCSRADHGIGVTEANAAAFQWSGDERDFGDDGGIGTTSYALNLWVR